MGRAARELRRAGVSAPRLPGHPCSTRCYRCLRETLVLKPPLLWDTLGGRRLCLPRGEGLQRADLALTPLTRTEYEWA